MQIIAITSTQAVQISVTGLISIGGEDGSGKRLKSLKERDDYVVISESEGQIAVHVLKGKKAGVVYLKKGELFKIADLHLTVLDESSLQANKQETNAGAFELKELLQEFSSTQDLAISMKSLIRNLIAVTSMEKALLIAQNTKGEYNLVTQEGVSDNEPWITESLIQETIKSQKSISIQNIFGSRFQSNQSIIATGLTSVHTWPLVVRGQCLGLILVGSQKPHSGFSKLEASRAETLSNLASVMLWFYVRDLKLKEEVTALRQLRSSSSDSPFLTTDKRLSETLDIAKKVSPTSLSILIQGETGVGKELLATWIHEKSDRSGKPFVAVNCGAIPSELLESTLFGHRKGAFTNAYADQIGKFQQADGGTLFLDEVGDLPESLQVKLLRALQEKTVEPVGGKLSKINVRILAASHRSIPQLISARKFREDLYFRLAEIVVEIPPLRERTGDIGLLATRFLKEFGPEKRFSTSAWGWLKTQEWRGNVRELLSSVKRAAILSMNSELTISDFTKGGPSLSSPTDSTNWLGGKNLDEAKSRFIFEKVRLALEKAGGNRNKAAELLGVTPRTLFRYLEEMGDAPTTDMTS